MGQAPSLSSGKENTAEAQQARKPPERQMPVLPKSYELFKRAYESTCSSSLGSSFFEKRIKDNAKESVIQACEREINKAALEAKQKQVEYAQKTVFSRPQVGILSIVDNSNLTKNSCDFFTKLYEKKKRLPEITDEMAIVIQDASYPNPSSEILAELNGIPITRKDMQTLLRLNWLNDEIINFYLNLIVQRSTLKGFKLTYTFNTFFYSKLRESGHSSIKRWTRKVDIFKFNYLLVPVHLGNHWCLAIIDFAERSISYYDSLGGSSHGCCDILLDYLRDESKDKRQIEFDDDNWRFVNAYNSNIPTQKNGSDCGVFACTYAEFLTRDAELEFSQDDMPYFRRKMIYEIVTKKLLEI